MLELKFDKEAVSYLKKIDRKTANRLLVSIELLLKIPPEGDIKKLKGLVGKYRLRVGDLRILYTISDKYIFINDIGPRGDIYK